MKKKTKTVAITMLGILCIVMFTMVGCSSKTEPPKEVIGFITEVDQENRTIQFDEIEWVTDEDVKRMEELNITIEAMPNRYYIHNPEQTLQQLYIDEDIEYALINWGGQYGDDQWEYITDDNQVFMDYLSTYQPGVKIPFWLTVTGDQVQLIREQFVP